MAEVIRAEIRGGTYHVENITAGSLPYLCVQLLRAGFDPDASVEAYRTGRMDWDIRAKSIRAGAAEARRGDEDGGSGVATPRRKGLTGGPSPPESGVCQKAPPIFKAENLIWHGLRLRLRSSNRDLAIIQPDTGQSGLFRIRLAPDRTTDLVNLVRAREAAMCLALAMLNREAVHRRARNQRRARQKAAVVSECGVNVRGAARRAKPSP